jgi:hypothetical protein
MQKLIKVIDTRAGKRRHQRQMTKQSVPIPMTCLVTFSIELGHPGGHSARHLSMSVGCEGQVPSPDGAWMVADVLGFTGALDQCVVWLERLQEHGEAVNVVQLIGPSPVGRA